MNTRQFVTFVVLDLLVLTITASLRPDSSLASPVSTLDPLTTSYDAPSATSLSSIAPISWTLSYSSSVYQLKALAVYDGKLYAGGSDFNQTNGRLFRYDGTSWVDTNFSTAVGVAVDMIESLQVFNGRLYIGTRVDVGGNKFSRLYYYDISFYQDWSVPGQAGNSGFEDLAVHNNTLYAAHGTNSSEVYQRNGDNNWVVLGSAIEAGSPVRALTSFNGSLFAGTGASGNQAKVWRWTGSDWTLEKNLTNDFGLTQDGAASLAAFNGRLYVGLMGSGTTSPIFVYDGASWTISTTISGCSFARLAAINDRLWAGSCSDEAYVFDGSTWELTGYAGQGGILDFAQYGQFTYASTLGNGEVYFLRYLVFLPVTLQN